MKGFVFGVLFASFVFFFGDIHSAYEEYTRWDNTPAGEVTSSNVGSDQYTFPSNMEVNSDAFTVFVEIHPDFESLQEAHDRIRSRNGQGIVYNDDLAAFSVIVGGGGHCIVHMVDPSVHYMPEFYGHEFLHCVYDKWHD